jgi:hypothetical protein
MKLFKPGKVIKRVVKIRSSDKAIADAEWIVALDGAGVRIKRFGAHGEGTMFLTWRSIVGHCLIHKAGYRPAVSPDAALGRRRTAEAK